MAQRPHHAAGDDLGGITPGTCLTDYATVNLTVQDGAAGGMGLVVWGPDALRGNQMWALKLLQPQRLVAAASPAARANIERQFEAEALVWCHLWEHECVIATTGLTRLTSLGNLPALVLEYAPNGSLREQLRLIRERRRPLPLEATLAWALHIASALAHIHQSDPAHDRPEPLVHCDLKPENVLIDGHGWAKLTDLGLTRAYATLATETFTPSATTVQADAAKTPAGMDHRALIAQLRAGLQAQGLLPGGAPHPPLPDATTLLATRTLRIPPAPATGTQAAGAGEPEERIGEGVAGSPPYMAPEQWRGMAKVVPATDIYAFGVILYELFAGYATPYLFPRDPVPYLTPAFQAQALAMGYDPALLAWHAAHTDPDYRRRHAGAASGKRAPGEHRLSDPEAWEAALTSGPCAELLASADGAGRARAETCLRRIDEIVTACLAWESTARPGAAELVRRLAALIEDPCGLAATQIPQPISSTPYNEGTFWGNLGETYLALGRQEDALVAKRRAVEHDPSSPVKWLNLGASLTAIGQSRDKEARHAETHGQPAEAARLREAARVALKEALDAYQQAQTRITPESLANYPMLSAVLASNEGSVLALLKRYAEAVAADERALQIAPTKHDTRFNLALHYALWAEERGATREERLARLEAAQRAITEAMAEAPEMTEVHELAAAIADALANQPHR